ncbi:hypothetical protein BKA65DRAFT_485023 [Rhexocercosporidium sp. MPI-PUGE-AT-0058]|nr:hypothetical protein BKA65DRAFT_485023 [Rhexocercosporidium sp. MPI-PUGE-AT-0058]
MTFPTLNIDISKAGSRREDIALTPASIINDTPPTGDFAALSENITLASIIKETIPGGIRSSTPINNAGQPSKDAAKAAAPATVIEETIPGGIRSSTPIDDAGQPSKDTAEDAAPATIIKETIPGGIRSSTPINDVG